MYRFFNFFTNVLYILLRHNIQGATYVIPTYYNKSLMKYPVSNLRSNWRWKKTTQWTCALILLIIYLNCKIFLGGLKLYCYIVFYIIYYKLRNTLFLYLFIFHNRVLMVCKYKYLTILRMSSLCNNKMT